MQSNDSRYQKGFRPDLSDEVREKLKALAQTNLPARVIEAIAYHFSIVAIAGGLCCMALIGPNWLAALLYLPSLILIARQQRAIELFVHDAGHYSWHRQNRKWNDWLANLLVAWPTLSTVQDYRRFHAKHHAYYGMDGLDPCKRRFAMFGSTGPLAYMLEWYSEIGSKGCTLLAKWAGWHLVVYILPLGLMFGWLTGVALWLAFWLLPMLTTLPALRRIAEAEEHDYDRASSEFATTYSNLGWIHIFLIHPAGDAYHLLHHLWPNIPMRRHRELHRFLMRKLPEYRDGPSRTKVLSKT